MREVKPREVTNLSRVVRIMEWRTRKADGRRKVWERVKELAEGDENKKTRELEFRPPTWG
jgi:hypothetical protein